MLTWLEVVSPPMLVVESEMYFHSRLFWRPWLVVFFSLWLVHNYSPLQCSCLENPRDGGAWWAAICGVAQSRTRLKRLSSSSSIDHLPISG